jgi:hypothetical protein
VPPGDRRLWGRPLGNLSSNVRTRVFVRTIVVIIIVREAVSSLLLEEVEKDDMM